MVRVRHNGFEVLNANNYVHLLGCREVLEVGSTK